MYLVVISSIIIGVVLFGIFIKVFIKNNEAKYTNSKVITLKQIILTYIILLCSVLWILQAIMLFMSIQSQILDS